MRRINSLPTSPLQHDSLSSGTMTAPLHSDALVFFGPTGDLAYKQIFPALQSMIRRGHLNVPIVGIAKSGWTLEQLRARARDSLEHHDGLDRDAFDKLCSLLRYVDGDYGDDETFKALRYELGQSVRPLRSIWPFRLAHSLPWSADSVNRVAPRRLKLQ